MELETSGSWILGCSGESRKGQRPHRTPQAVTSQLLLPPEVEVTWGQARACTLVMGGCPEDTRRNLGEGRMATRCCSVCDGERWEVPPGPEGHG